MEENHRKTSRSERARIKRLSPTFVVFSETFLHFPPLSSTFLHFRLRKVFFRSTHRQKRLASLFIRSENRGINTRYFYDAKLVPHVIFSERFSKRLSPTFLHFPRLSSTFLLDFSPLKVEESLLVLLAQRDTRFSHELRKPLDLPGCL